jgi:hypothetical protein
MSTCLSTAEDSLIKASLVIDRDDGADGLVSMELDETLNFDSEGEPGNTSFGPDTKEIFFIIHHDATVKIQWVRPTDGSTRQTSDKVEDTSRERFDDQVLWVNDDDEHELAYVPSTDPEPLWYGNEAVGLKKKPNSVRTMIITSTPKPSLCKLAYEAKFTSFVLNVPTDIDLTEYDGETYHITIVAHMVKA